MRFNLMSFRTYYRLDVSGCVKRFNRWENYFDVFAFNLKLTNCVEYKDEKYLSNCSLVLKFKHYLEDYLVDFVL